MFSNSVIELIDIEIYKLKQWIECCRGGRLNNSIPDYENRIQYWENVKQKIKNADEKNNKKSKKNTYGVYN